ncbi:MAG: hypothetical protein V5804_15560 [Mucilaginibacter sp.]|uniref:hypothetical protein n=1 Tax=Mucilaginibacter sp. TaxID=1882438 RepID=UPI0034E45B42
MKIEKDLSGNEPRKNKFDMIKEAASDPLFLADIKEVAGDFAAIDFETLDDDSI